MHLFAVSLILISCQRIAAVEPPARSSEKSSSYDTEAQAWLEDFNSKLTPLFVNASILEWNWATNITEYNELVKTEAGLRLSNFSAEQAFIAYKKFDLAKIEDVQLKRMIDRVQRSRVGSTPTEREWMAKASNKLSTIYNTAKVCPSNLPEDCAEYAKISFTPDLDKIFKDSRNETELRLAWKRWRDAAGKPAKEYYFDIIKNTTEYEKRIGYNSITEKWLYDYESDDLNFRDELWELFQEILPFYEDIHAYVRFRLAEKYGSNIVDGNGTIPAHLLGNMWAQMWGNIFELAKPFPDEQVKIKTVTEAMQEGNWTAMKIFEAAEDFFKSINMPALPNKFWEKSLIEKPKDGREVVCHASAWDMVVPNDVRIKMCTQIDSDDLGTVHHELGHIYYYLAYKDQPLLFREGANPGFHEAVGDAIFISSNQDVYLKHLGLIPQDYTPSYQGKINKLMEKALDGVVFFPFGYMIDLWRWDLFDGKVPKNLSNAYWWQLRTKYQGVHPPVSRTNEDFDPAAKYHVSNFVPYIRYYVARFLQYEFHDSLCREAGFDERNVSTCSIFDNKKAGDTLWEALKLGLSIPWPETLKMITGSKKMSAKPVLNFYKDLREWLREENKKNRICLGWGADWPGVKLNEPRCGSPTTPYNL